MIEPIKPTIKMFTNNVSLNSIELYLKNNQTFSLNTLQMDPIRVNELILKLKSKGLKVENKIGLIIISK